ncbi:isoleucine--tRNA ligase [Ignicoccus hospitalis]|uniref:Isoleucine--tRNA ligase n=1 Tax=Ignicoccus hospitalis (strain KIN4/I / DSM 18386 / JCM 14125) TaxID=453591 RepID=A8AB94_IGNH4|nr:isoleucine--tRNA ligase [Ignicoccus hospitalis]ABU82196.1 Isoleucyl-tRNA synthetase [Ignicoccus hospitalis KIN4/I]
MEPKYDPLKVEEEVFKFWKENKIYEKVKELSKKRGKVKLFRFLEGPPTANGFMHVGHMRGRTYKDVILRFWRMKGYWVWDQAGWDTQGLPVELEVEKKHGFKSKKDILKYGVEKFVKECQELVDYYISHWRADSERMGLWLDYDNAYETRHPKYLDAAWSYLKKMFDQGRIYKGLRVVAVCPRCETALSSHEVALGYKTVKDPSFYFKLPLKDEEETYLVAWTTTPWTIIANEAAAVHPYETYVKIEVDANGKKEKWILAEKRLEPFAKEVGLKDYKVLEKFKGEELIGKEYVHPLLEEVPAHKEHPKPHHTVIEGAVVRKKVLVNGKEIEEKQIFVSMDSGTGIVHMAPAHGAEDFEACRRVGIEVFRPIRKDGHFTEEAGKYAGMWFKEAEKEVIKDLKEKGLAVHVGTIEHEYPHCWRCDTPLMYYADEQWFIKVEDLRETLVNENDKVTWYPKWAYDRMSDWLQNAKDWTISRERFWGTPLPIWTCTSCGHRVAVSSLDELKKVALNPEAVVDHHRPWVDEVKLKCPKCGGVMVREPYVVDVWLDSGVAHTASLKQIGAEDYWDLFYPYDWITEALDQTRGWFYTLLVTGVTWHGRAPYKQVLTQGHILDKHGKKMSKSKGNVVWAKDVFKTYGADPVRFFFAIKSAPWDSVRFDPEDIKLAKRTLDILWNSVKFAKSYMELDKWSLEKLEEGLKSLEPEDSWVLWKLNEYSKRVAEELERSAIHRAAQALQEFIVEVLSHKYITLVRPRVWEEEETPSKLAAYSALFLALDAAIRMSAPFVPFLAEYLYQRFQRALGFEEESVHMLQWPEENSLYDPEEAKAVEELLEAAEKVLALRTERGVKRRWPLPEAYVVVKSREEKAERVKVKRGNKEAEEVIYKPALSVVAVKRAAKALGVYANVLDVKVVEEPPAGDFDVIETESLKVYVKVRLDERTKMLGLAREVIRRIQTMRKEEDLPLDYVLKKVIVFSDNEEILKAVEEFKEYVAKEVRAEEVVTSGEPPEGKEWSLEGSKVVIALVK